MTFKPSVVNIELDRMEHDLTPFWDALDRGFEIDSQDEVYYAHELAFTKAFYKLCDMAIRAEERLNDKWEAWNRSDSDIPWLEF